MARYPLNLPNQGLDDAAFPHVTYRRGAGGQPTPVLRGTGVRGQTVVVATQAWGLSPTQVADEYDLSEAQVKDALAIYEVHRQKIEAGIAAEQAIEWVIGTLAESVAEVT